jgi:tetratricopeptide (TPR) repeat protein
VADHHLVPGKKFWTWGTGERGKMWEKILTETDGPYIELMVGAFSDNQPDYSWLQPYEVRTVKQYWYPVRRIKGVKNANLEAAVNLEWISEKNVQIGFNTTQDHEGAKARLESKGNKVYEEILNIGPSRPFFKKITLPSPVERESLSVVLLSPDGTELIKYQPLRKADKPIPEPVKPPPPPEDIPTTEELFHAGLRLEQFYSPVYEPDPYYEEILKRDPGNARANTALGILFLKRGMFDEAVKKFRKALERITHNYTSPKDGEASYYLGVALRAQKNFDKAYRAFYKATWNLAWSAASYYALAELACLRQDYKKALEFCDRSLARNAWNLKCLNLRTGILRRQGKIEEAEKLAKDVLEFSPLDFWAGNELYLVKSLSGLENEAEMLLSSLGKTMRDNTQSYLETAVDYGNCGFWEEAVEVLQRLCSRGEKGASTYPLVYYYLAYYSEKLGNKEEALKYYQKASRMPADYCFPFRLETAEILRRAQLVNPEDARAPYYLGNLYFDLQPGKALKLWEKSVSLDGGFYLSQRNLGMASARVVNDLDKAVRCMEEAVRLKPGEPRLYYELDLLYEAAQEPPKDRLKLLMDNHGAVKQRDDSYSREILLLVEIGDYSRAIKLLENFHFHIWEGGGRIHNVYVDAHLFRGYKFFQEKQYDKALQDYLRALEYPKNLEVGRPRHGGRAAQVFYYVGTAHEALGDLKKARNFYKKSAAQKRGLTELSYFQALSLEKLGKADEAADIFQRLIDLGNKRLEVSTSPDFFVKFGERQSEAKRQAQAHYILGLGYLGLGKTAEAEDKFKKAAELDINHVWTRHFLGLR